MISEGTDSCQANATLPFFDVVRPPELLQFVDDVIPILHGERAFSHHHNSPGDVVIGTIYIRVPKSVAKIESVTAFALVYVLTDLRRAFYVQYAGLTLITFNEQG